MTRKYILFFDFNLEVNDDNALVIMEYYKDKYGMESLIVWLMYNNQKYRL